MQVVFVDGFKGVRYNTQSAKTDFEIYDLKTDPKESTNLAKRAGFETIQSKMKARALQVRKPDPSAPRPYDAALVPPAENAPPSPQVSWSLFKGEWPWMPDFRTMTPASKGETENIALSMNPSDGPFGIQFESWFHAATDGDYSFSIVSDGGAMLFLHDIRVIDEPKSPSGGTLTGSVRLKAGWHPMRLLYRHWTGTPKLDLSAKPR